MEPFRQKKGKAQSQYYSGELAEASVAAHSFIEESIRKHGLRRDDGYHIETRCVSLSGVNLNEDTHGHWSDNELCLLLDKMGEVVAMAYISRNDINCAEVIVVDLYSGVIPHHTRTAWRLITALMILDLAILVTVFSMYWNTLFPYLDIIMCLNSVFMPIIFMIIYTIAEHADYKRHNLYSELMKEE